MPGHGIQCEKSSSRKQGQPLYLIQSFVDQALKKSSGRRIIPVRMHFKCRGTKFKRHPCKEQAEHTSRNETLEPIGYHLMTIELYVIHIQISVYRADQTAERVEVCSQEYINKICLVKFAANQYFCSNKTKDTSVFSVQKVLELIWLIDGDNSDMDLSDNNDPILDGKVPTITTGAKQQLFKLKGAIKVVIVDVPEDLRRMDNSERQYLPMEPNPVGIKNFVCATADGIVLDFELYQDTNSMIEKVEEPEGLGLGSLVIKRLCQTLQCGTKVYCDRFFTTINGAQRMTEKELYITGTIMKNQLAGANHKLLSDKAMKNARKSEVVRQQTSIDVVHGTQPEDTCQYWDKKFKQYVTVSQPSIVHLALANSWLLYRKDHAIFAGSRTRPIQFLQFRMEVAKILLAQHHGAHANLSGQSEEKEDSNQGVKRHVIELPHVSVHRRANAHLPEMTGLKNAMRCRQPGCTGRTRVCYVTCKVFLCLQTKRNCYSAFHTGDGSNSQELLHLLVQVTQIKHMHNVSLSPVHKVLPEVWGKDGEQTTNSGDRPGVDFRWMLQQSNSPTLTVSDSSE
ncbi:hypothetical protein D9C73_006024 [Collichthys lucidus]|uniref:PiggyBac transposable element-derived protein domain-containing protein n=1 Tax=Collichthys lucidus TaxID=240159 RepID=A0A4U5UD71_COLLU|nr:hypothetical protein D9C73_006024 [Collichthys lucidus]